jgi:hypothetical protein
MEFNIKGFIQALRVEAKFCTKGQNLISANILFSLARALDNCVNGVLAEKHHVAVSWTAQPDPKPVWGPEPEKADANDKLIKAGYVEPADWFPNIGWSKREAVAETTELDADCIKVPRLEYERMKRHCDEITTVSVQRMERIHELECELKRVEQQRDMLYGIVSQASELLKNGG